MNAEYLTKKFESALSYSEYLATDPEKAANWNKIYDQTKLTDEQQTLIKGFTRKLNVLCISGIWCGDCAQQGPLFEHIAEANSLIDLRWVDRDEHEDLADQITLNQGKRVPMLIFMAEDCEIVSIKGDRSLTRYRAIAARALGASCPLPGAAVADDELAATLQDWLDEFERVHLLLRTSGRLRNKHGD